MFGVGIGMLYTPLLVDRMQLPYPSGLAVANILRALTDRALLKRSIAKLGGGMLLGYVTGVSSLKVAAMTAIGVSASTLGGGMIVGARIAIPALVVALIGAWQKPHLVSIGWLGMDDPYRKIGFIISLGTILGAAILDVGIVLARASRRFREQAAAPARPAEDWKRVNTVRLLVWVAFWGTGTAVVGSSVLHQPMSFLLVGIGLSFLFVLVNGISQGLSDWNPLSSAFVMTVFIMAAIGLRDASTGLLCASILVIACNEGCDMQQDRSTGARLGTNRVIQFRYQVIGITMGAVLAVALAKLFMSAFPILTQDQFAHPHLAGAQKWQSAMTFKIVGALRGITHSQPHVMKALQLGVALGLLIELARKLIKGRPGYQRLRERSLAGRTADFLLDAVVLPSPYASSFGGFVELPTVLWWTTGGIGATIFDTVTARRPVPAMIGKGAGLPADMSTMSLVGGGLIAGDSLAALSVGVYGLLQAIL
jgi:uncharacterized oligopeptide transporter (OPT) family protein